MLEIWLYTAEYWSHDQADAYVDEIDAALLRVRQHPHSGTDFGHVRAGYRRLSVGEHRIFYVVRDNLIDVMRVLHARMDPAVHL